MIEIDNFWRFVHERQEIWYHRVILVQDPPWTDDPILRKFHFVNVYRDLDYGTIYLRDMLEHVGVRDLKEALWYVTMYRLVNRVGTFERLGGLPPPDQNLDGWLAAFKGLDGPKFTGRHQTRSIDNYVDTGRWLFSNLTEVTGALKAAYTGREAIKVLRTIPKVGAFFAYQIYLDLLDTGLLRSIDDGFVELGTGARLGLRRIYPDIRSREMPERVRDMVAKQDIEFQRLGLEFRQWTDIPLRVREVEHALCEFNKYCMLRDKVQRRLPKLAIRAEQKWWGEA